MIFATDLDRTIIFSYRFIKDNKQREELICMEESNNKEISYMKKETFLKLLDLNKLVTITPVTMRSLKEYTRLLFAKEMKYAIVANGGMILKNGKPLADWQNKIKTLKPHNYLEVSELLKQYNSMFKKDIKLVDDVYFFASVKDTLTEHKESIKEEIQASLDNKTSEWKAMCNGNKIYIYPKNITKDKALAFLKQYIEKEEGKKFYMITAGDALVDLPILKLGDQRIIPENSAILKHNLDNLFYLKVKENFDGTLDMLNIVEMYHKEIESS